MANMSADERRQYSLSRLEDHRHLLRTAIAAMAAGDLTRALNVATSIRVLVHETSSQKPLLKKLTPSYLDLPILERGIPRPQNVSQGTPVVPLWLPIYAKIFASEGKITVGLITDFGGPSYQHSTLGAWWDNPCMVLPGLGPFFRRELILNLADKEGAHVDANISQRYQVVLSSQYVRASTQDISLGALNVSRLIAGRAGVELLDCLDKNFPVSNPPPPRT
jgi:hypothetical protein